MSAPQYPHAAGTATHGTLCWPAHTNRRPACSSSLTPARRRAEQPFDVLVRCAPIAIRLFIFVFTTWTAELSSTSAVAVTVAALAGTARPAAADLLQLARIQQGRRPRVLRRCSCSVSTLSHRQGQAPLEAILVLLPHRSSTPHRRHHVAKTRPSNISAHHELALLPACFPRARVNSSAHVLAPRTLAAASAAGTATAPRAARAHCDSAKGGTRCPRRKMLLPPKNSDLATTFDVRRGLVSSRARRARARPQSPLYEKHSTIFLTYHTVPKTYLAVQDRELVSNPTNRSARNGQNTKSFRAARLLTTARGWHGAFTPAHGICQNRPKQSGLSIDI